VPVHKYQAMKAYIGGVEVKLRTFLT